MYLPKLGTLYFKIFIYIFLIFQFFNVVVFFFFNFNFVCTDLSELSFHFRFLNLKKKVTNKIYCLWFFICCFISHFFCSLVIYDELTCFAFFIRFLLSLFCLLVWVIVVRPKGVGDFAFILIFILLFACLLI